MLWTWIVVETKKNNKKKNKKRSFDGLLENTKNNTHNYPVLVLVQYTESWKLKASAKKNIFWFLLHVLLLLLLPVLLLLHVTCTCKLCSRTCTVHVHIPYIHVCAHVCSTWAQLRYYYPVHVVPGSIFFALGWLSIGLVVVVEEWRHWRCTCTGSTHVCTTYTTW